MHVRLVRGEIKAGLLDTAVQRWTNQIAPVARTQTGFVRASLLVDRATNQFLTMVVWNSLEALQANIAWNRDRVSSFGDLFVGAPTIEEGFEVAAEANLE